MSSPIPLDHAMLAGANRATAGPLAFAADTGVAYSNTIVRDSAGFDALEADWNALFAAAARPTHVFQSYNWCWHWCRTFLDPATGGGSPPALAIVVVREGDRPVLIWPLVIERSAGVRVLTWLGEPVSQYGDVLLDPACDREKVLDSAWRTIASDIAPDVVRLRKVRADAEIALFLARHGAIVTAEAEAPCLDLASAPDFAAYEQRYAAKARKNRRRLLRRLEERGPIAFEFLEGGEAARDGALIGLSLKRAWLRDRGLVSPALADPRVDRFFADCALGAVRPVGCRVSLLRSGGEPAAVEIGFACQHRLAIHVIAFNLKFEKAGAGVLHMEQSIRRGFAEGFRSYDLLAPRGDYKMDWADQCTTVRDHAVPLTLKGRTYARLYLGFARERLKAAVEAMPPGLRRLATNAAALLAIV